ncbi:MAG: protein kinase, partial [Euzebyales bacterium]|nr:protein kinase [Euzebyales bacterium]
MSEDRVPATLPIDRSYASGMLADRYEVGRLLGEGPAGHVYAARDLLLERDVAVKVLDGLRSRVEVRRAVRAIRAASRVSDNHLLRVLDVNSGSPPFAVLPVEEVRTLQEAFEREEPSQARALAIVTDLLGALAALHREGAVHRGVSADNVLVRPEGRVLLTTAALSVAARDPGLGAAAEVAQTLARAVTITSPEHSLGQPAGPRSDVAAIAALAQQLFPEEAPPQLQPVLRRAGAEDPAERFRDATEMVQAWNEALRSATDAQPSITPPPPPAAVTTDDVPSRPARPRQHDRARPPQREGGSPRRWFLAAGLTLLLVVAAGIAAWAWLAPMLTDRAADPTVPPAGVPDDEEAAGGGGEAAPGTGGQPPDRFQSFAADFDGAGPDVLGSGGQELLDDMGPLSGVTGPERQRQAAALLGAVEVAEDRGKIPGDFADSALAALRDASGVAGLIALAAARPAESGPDSARFARRLEKLSALTGDERAAEAVELIAAAKTAEIDGELSFGFAGAVIPVLTEEAGIEGLLAVLERDPDAGEAGGAAFAEGLRSLDGPDGDATLAELYGTVGNGLDPFFGYAARKVLEPRVTLDEVAALAARDPSALGPAGPELAARLQDLDSLEPEARGAEAAALYGAVRTGREAGITAEFMAAAAAPLRREFDLDDVVVLGDRDEEALGPRGGELLDELADLGTLRGARRRAKTAELYGIAATAPAEGELAAAFAAAASRSAVALAASASRIAWVRAVSA